MKRFSKKISTVLLVALLAIALIGCSSTAKIETAPGIIVAGPTETNDTVSSVSPAPAPAPEFTEPEPESEPVLVSEAEPAVEEDNILASRVIDMYGYTARIDAYDGYALVSYPTIVTDSDISQAVAALNAAYPGELVGVTYEITTPGEMTVRYPEGISADVINAYLNILVSDLEYYVSNLAIVVPVAEPAVEVSAPAVKEAEPVAEQAKEAIVTRDISLYGYSATIEAYDGYALVTYPTIVTDSDISQAVAALNAAYPGALEGVTYQITAPGEMKVTYPSGLTEAEINAYIDELVSNLEYYVASIVSSPEPVVSEPAVEVSAPAVKEAEPVAEQAKEAIVTRDISLYGYSATIEAYDGYALVTYPTIVTDSDISQAVAALNAAYPGALEGVTYQITAPGEMKVTYPIGLTEAEINAYIDELVSNLEYYVASIVSSPEPVAPVDAPVVETKEVTLVEDEPQSVEPAVYLGGITAIEKDESGKKEFDLYVVHTNDVHARIVPSDGGMGYSKFATLLKMGRSMTDDILLLDAGDVSHGTNLANVFEGETVGVLLDMLGYDAVSPGNHDFNYGYDALVEKAKLAEKYSNLKVLAANVTYEDGSLVFQPYQIYDFNGYKVVVIGLVTPDTKTKAHPKYTEGIEFMSDAVVNNAQAFLDYANDIADFVIVLGHIGLDADGSSGITSDWISSNLNGIDLFVDGHSHTVLEHGLQVNDTLIVSTGEYLKNFGVVTVHFSPEDVSIVDARLVSAEEVNAPEGTVIESVFGLKEVPNDPEVDAYVETMEAKLNEVFDVVVATIPTDLDGEREHVRTRKTNLSKLIVAAMTEDTGADFTITNGGGIRASLSKGDVTLGDINNVLPFTNTIAVCEITPAEVYAALEHGYSMLPETNGGYAQTDLQVIYSKTAPAGSRILRVLLNGKLLDRNDTTTIYKVATNDFMGAGGDGYTMFGREVGVGRMLNEVFASYLAETYPPKN